MASSATTASGGQTLALPEGLNPDNLDTLTELAVLLNRLRMPTSTSGTGTTPAPTPSQPPSQSQHRSQPQLQQHGPPTTTHTGELSLKEIPPAADVLKHRFQRARALVRALPDMGRRIPDQEAEIAALEARLARQRDMLARLREMGARLAAVSQDDGDGDRMVVD